MLLEKITITDWRCFYGEQLIEFASQTKKNVTLIHAENGVGKTSLLNALLWCFYNKTTARFEKPDDILNHQARREGRNLATIAVEFSHEDNLYEARRIFRSDSLSAHQNLIVTRIATDGSNQQMRSDPNLFLNSVLPAEMAGHFLFDGEHAEALTGNANATTVSRAIRDILGCSFVSQTIETLENIEVNYRRKVAASNTIQKANETEAALNKYERLSKKLFGELQELDEEIALLEGERDGIERSLSTFSNIKQAQFTKESALKTIQREEKYEQRAVASQQTWVAEHGTYVLAQRNAEHVVQILKSHELENTSQTKFPREIITKVLELGECICGSCIAENADLKKFLEEQLDTAESLELQARLTKVKALTRRLLSNGKHDAVSKYDAALRQEIGHRKAIEEAEVTYSEATRSIESADVESIAQLQKDSTNLYNQIMKKRQLKGELGLKLRTAEKNIPKLRSQLDLMLNSAGADKAVKDHLAHTQHLVEFLKEKLDAEINNARKIINIFVREIIERTARKNFKVLVDKNFSVQLKDEYGTDMAKSEGENQLLGLAFTGALAKFAKIRKNAKSKLLLPGTEAPLVLDAPFGKLDSIYKHATAEFLPEMASQVVVMVNKEQGSAKVLELLKDHIGFQYALVRHNKSPQGEKRSEQLVLDEKSIEITSYDSLFDGTAIEAL